LKIWGIFLLLFFLSLCLDFVMDLTLIGDVGKAWFHFLNSFQMIDTAEYVVLILLIALFLLQTYFVRHPSRKSR